VAKCHGPRAGGGLLGPPVSELKTLKTHLSAKYNYLKMCNFYVSNFIEICNVFYGACNR
jgi:hypothetical protein